MLTARQILRAVEPVIFGWRILSLIIIGLVTLAFAVCSVLLFKYNTSTNFQKGLPTEHEYIENFNAYKDQFGSGDLLLVAVQNTQGDIYNKEFLERLAAIESRLRALPGINRSRFRSLFSEDTRYLELVEGGFKPQRVLASNWASNPAAIEVMEANVDKAQLRGLLVGLEGNSTLLLTELYPNNPLFIDEDDANAHTSANANDASAGNAEDTDWGQCTPTLPNYLNLKAQFPAGEPLNYVALAKLLEQQIRIPCETDGIKVHVIGTVMVVGEIVDSFADIVMFFCLALVLTAILLWLYCGSLRLAILPLICSVVAVFWELGLLYVAGLSLDPFAVLIPFLTLAVGVSHGVQMVNCWAAEVGTHGHDSKTASVISFRRLAIPGTAALITDVIGFVMIALIPIPIVQEMAINAAFGLAAIIITNKWLMPILLSYTQLVNRQAFSEMQARRERAFQPIFYALSRFTEKRVAVVVLIVCAGLFGVSVWQSQTLHIGDIKPGAAQLKPDSRFNQDVAELQQLFGRSQDIFQIIIDARAPSCVTDSASAACQASQQDPGCLNPEVVSRIDRLGERLQATPNVLHVMSMPVLGREINQAAYAGRLTQSTLRNDRDGLKLVAKATPVSLQLRNTDCDLMSIMVSLTDHKAATLNRIVTEVEQFTANETALTSGVRAEIKLASGNAGIATAVNQVVETWEKPILLFVYGAIILMCLVSFRSFASSLCVLLPLALVSMLTYAVMAWLDIGLTVATLPVAAFGVGLGVDYGIYIFSTLLDRIKAGSDLRQAYYETLQTTGRAVVFTGVALSVGVLTWLLSSLQFQADMGLILVFMFLANMLGAIIVLPALARFLINVDKVRESHVDLSE